MNAPGMVYHGWTPEDFQRLNRLNLARRLVVLRMIRKGDRPDFDIMLARTRAKIRGVTPIQQAMA